MLKYDILNRLSILCILCLLFACNDAIIEESDDGLFVPQTDMTHSQIVDLLEQAIKNTTSSDEISYTIRDTTSSNNENYYNLTREPIIEVIISFNKQMQKSLELFKDDSNGIKFYFVDGCDNYICHLGDILLKNKLTDIYWPCILGISTDDFDFNFNKYTWIIEGKRFIGQFEGAFPSITGFSSFTEVLEINLTKDLKINSYHSNRQVDNLMYTSYYKRKCSCTYTANPTMPQGYHVSNFSPMLQYEVKIIWENGKDNIFYAADNGSGQENYTFYPYEVSRYYNTNQVLQLFYDANYMKAVEIPVIVTENVTFYAKWVDYDKIVNP